MSIVTGQVLKFNTWWAQRAPRERRLLLAMTAVLAIGIAVWLADWIQSEQKRLARTLPQARSSLATVQEATTELAKLKRDPKRPAPAADAMLAQLKASSTARGLPLTLELNGDAVHGQGKLAFDSLVGWLGEIQHDPGLRVTDIKVAAEGTLSAVDFHLSLADKGR